METFEIVVWVLMMSAFVGFSIKGFFSLRKGPFVEFEDVKEVD